MCTHARSPTVYACIIIHKYTKLETHNHITALGNPIGAKTQISFMTSLVAHFKIQSRYRVDNILGLVITKKKINILVYTCIQGDHRTLTVYKTDTWVKAEAG